MPNSFLPAVQQGKQTKEGVILVGDSWNMRHPLTGGGMTVAFNDIVILRDLLIDVKQYADWTEVSSVLHRWHWARKPLSSTVNILSVALYDLFGAHGGFARQLRSPQSLIASQIPSSRSFVQGASSTSSSAATASATPSAYSPRASPLLRATLRPDSLALSFSIEQAPVLLFRHFFTVAFYSIWVLFTHPRQVAVKDGKPVLRRPRPDEYPLLAVKSLQVVSPSRFRFPLRVRSSSPLRLPLTRLCHSSGRRAWCSCPSFGPRSATRHPRRDPPLLEMDGRLPPAPT